MSDKIRDAGKTPSTTRRTRNERRLVRDQKKVAASVAAPSKNRLRKPAATLPMSEDDQSSPTSYENIGGAGEGSSRVHGSSQEHLPQFQQVSQFQHVPQFQQVPLFQQPHYHQSQYRQPQHQQYRMPPQYGMGMSPSYGTQQYQQFPTQQYYQQPPSYQQPFYHQPMPTPPAPQFYSQPRYGVPQYPFPQDFYSQPGQSSNSTADVAKMLTMMAHSTHQHEKRHHDRDESSSGEEEEEEEEAHPEAEAAKQEQPAERVASGSRRWRRNIVRSGRYDPELKEGILGGPKDPSLLKGFEAHVAYDIYQHRERPPLKFHIRSTMLDGWRPSLTRTWGQFVDGSVFGHIRDILHDVLDIPLMTAFIERWQPETNSFHLPCCEMTVTLHDVYKIMGLQIRGGSMGYNPKLVSEGSYQTRQDWMVNNVCTEFSLNLADIRSGNMSWSAFKKHIMTKEHNFDTKDKVTAYLVFLMSAALFPDKTGDRVDLRYVIYLDLLERLEGTAWGTGVLCHLYRALGECSRADCRQAAFCYTLLQTWIYEHFPRFRPLERPQWDANNPVPYARRWFHGVNAPTTDLASYRMALDRLTIAEISFMPYGPLDFTDPELAPSLFHGVLCCLHNTEPYMPDRVSRQFGRVQRIPMAPITPIKAYRRRKIISYSVYYDPMEWAWGANWFRLEALGEATVFQYQCSDDYDAWFAKISHRFVSSPSVAAINAARDAYRVMLPYWKMPPPEQIGDMHGAIVRAMNMLRPFHNPSYDYH